MKKLALGFLAMGLAMTAKVIAAENCEMLLELGKVKHEAIQNGYAKHYLATPKAWNSYFESTAEDSAPRATLTFALNYFSEHHIKPGFAVDIGAGTGRDTLYLLAQGWQVHAVDFAPKAIDIIKQRAHDLQLTQPTAEVSDFTHMHLPYDIDLVTSYLAIPFTKPEHFLAVWNNISQHLRPGGLFAGSLLGEHDAFAAVPTITTLSQAQIQCLMRSYQVLYFKRVSNVLASSNQKPWEIWEFVVRKP